VSAPGAEPGDVLRRIHSYLAESPWATRVRGVLLLAGDASDRRYARVTLSGGETLVLAMHDGSSEAAIRFVQVAELFRKMPVRVPALLARADSAGVLALEDLGDVTLQQFVAVAGASERTAMYREAVEIIVVMQRRGAELASEPYPPFALAFDQEKLTSELDFFARHFLEAHRGAVLTPAEQGALREEWRSIATDLAGESRVLCHRDFHSRNLMVQGGQLAVIDFQDARMGPDTYDLVSLLRDCYVDVADGERRMLIAAFLQATGRAGDETFESRFDLMSVQRHLKALGTFGYQATARQRTGYLADVPRTLRYARDTLHGYPRFSRLLTLLAAHVQELR
jgi:N-acetylmuramate 1-kinase